MDSVVVKAIVETLYKEEASEYCKSIDVRIEDLYWSPPMSPDWTMTIQAVSRRVRRHSNYNAGVAVSISAHHTPAQCPVELQTKVRRKIRNHGYGPY